MDNYHPILLVQVRYKIFSALLLYRLQANDIEASIWKTQFGFRPKRGTQDAIFIIKRLIDRCFNFKNCSSTLLALDWAKAFDSINSSYLLAALRRFGLPQKMLNIISNIYTDRTFSVLDFGVRSSIRKQHFGISQGCPLSPYLFIMVMTVLLHDAQSMLQVEYGIVLSDSEINELVYADDTLLVSSNAEVLQKYLQCLASVGRDYGLTLNWSKVEQMNIGDNAEVLIDEDDNCISNKNCMKYLGAQLHVDGRI